MLAANIDDLRRHARRRLPRMFFDYLDGGAFSETTLRRNRTDFDDLLIEQRILRDVAHRDLGASFLGRKWSAPFMLAPIGFCGMMDQDGEVKAARAAEAAGIPFCLSTMAIGSLSHVGDAVSTPPMYQLYVFKDRELTRDMLRMASERKVPSLFLTVDANVSGIRERDTRNGFRTATHLGLRPLIDLAMHPGWCLRMAPGGMPRLGNITGRTDMGRGVMAQASRLSAQIDPSLTWADVAWMRSEWKGRLVIKGILSVADARAAVAAGVDAIVVSNHGGRQLDGAASSIAQLPAIAAAVGAQTEILLDSGIRRGSDIFKALALGADAVMIGRSFVYGLAAGGQRGVAKAIDLLRAELDVAMALSGVHTVAEIRQDGPRLVRHVERMRGS
jgi:isopentenyl diphosphate isomerase/L-lactate dehydrogenase-like FMN-dependent dehydrogenase